MPDEPMHPKIPHKLAIGDTSKRAARAFDGSTRVVRLRSDIDAYFRFGDAEVTASREDHFIGAGEPARYSLGHHAARPTHMAVIAAEDGDEGTLHISELS